MYICKYLYSIRFECKPSHSDFDSINLNIHSWRWIRKTLCLIVLRISSRLGRVVPQRIENRKSGVESPYPYPFHVPSPSRAWKVNENWCSMYRQGKTKHKFLSRSPAEASSCQFYMQLQPQLLLQLCRYRTASKYIVQIHTPAVAEGPRYALPPMPPPPKHISPDCSCCFSLGRRDVA